MMFAPRYTVWHCGYLKKGKREMNTEADDWANERQSNTPRTDSATFYADTSVTVTELCVTEEFARTLERENAVLRNALSRLIEVHDAMGGKCGTVRIAAEEALKEEGK
jgi:hypothetical protein